MAKPTRGGHLKVKLVPHTHGYGTTVDGPYTTAIEQAKQGGDATRQYFDSTNQTAGFWSWMSSHAHAGTTPFAPGKDKDGNPIQMASSGNVAMRMGAFYRGGAQASRAPATAAAAKAPAPAPAPAQDAGAAPAGDPAPVFGIATIETGNTTSGVTRVLSFGLSLAGLPAGLALTSALFGDLISPIYQNLKTFVVQMASELEEASAVLDTVVDPEAEVADAAEEASGEVQPVEGALAEEGAEYLAVDWASVGLEAAGLGAVAAIPMIVNALGHQMTNSLEIHNLTGTTLAWYVDQVHGQPSVAPKQTATGQVIPAMDYNTDQWGDTTTAKVAYSLDMQFVNSSNLGSIGYVLTLVPGDGGAPINLVVSVPWAGNNVIWAGTSGDQPQTIYDTYSASTSPGYGKPSWSAVVGDYAVTISISALTGTTEQDKYFYGTLVVVEPKKG